MRPHQLADKSSLHLFGSRTQIDKRAGVFRIVDSTLGILGIIDQ
jgi:hypothetical protein